jgi:hypothetical protein
MNRKIFSSLTATQQNALRNAGRVAFTAEANAVAQREDDARRVICRIGIPFVQARPAQLTALRAAVQPVYSQIERDPDNAHAIRAIEKLKRNTPADVAMCSSQGTVVASVASRSTSIDGTYSTSFSKQQLAHSHSLTDAGETNDENWGTLAIRFDHGGMTSPSETHAQPERKPARTPSTATQSASRSTKPARDRIPLERLPGHAQVPARRVARRRSDTVPREASATRSLMKGSDHPGPGSPLHPPAPAVISSDDAFGDRPRDESRTRGWVWVSPGVRQPRTACPGRAYASERLGTLRSETCSRR